MVIKKKEQYELLKHDLSLGTQVTYHIRLAFKLTQYLNYKFT